MQQPANDPSFVPYLPESAPFTPEQRAYLNGFLAGLFSRAPVPAGGTGFTQPAAPALTSLSIFFGSQTGNAEALSKRIAKEAAKRGFAPTVHDLAKYPAAQLGSEQRLLIVTSTYGDGEPPDNAKPFWEFLNSGSAPKLTETRFAICALGDSNYPKFCGFGKDLDARLEALGAQRALPRADCDVEFEEPFAKWLNEALTKFGTSAGNMTSGTTNANGVTEETEETTEVAPQYSRSNPFPAQLVINRKLNAPGSEKDTRHFEIDLTGSGLTYEVGDALGIFPTNCPELVDDLLTALHFSGGEAVAGRNSPVPVREAFLRHYEITKIPLPLLRVMAERTDHELLKKLAAPDANGELSKFLWGREIIDLLLAHPEVTFTPIEFVALLKKLSPRLYSISSSPKAHADRVHATVNVVRYESLSRRRKGVCSTFLADRVPSDKQVPVFLQANKNFRLPNDPGIPLIMVGPGTGIAPFRGFLHERMAVSATGKNWLFYGDQRSATDFMYREELETIMRKGVLTRLDTAFSRDQTKKVYVQDRMREHGRELFVWLEEGAYFYVCGDASRMAKDVEAALHEIIQTAGGLTLDAAKEYVAKLKAEKRYQRDVY